jgi:hypothetical protein
MGIYGLEEQFWVGDYQFDVGFSNENDVGLSQRDICVGQRRKVEDLTLAEFTGPQLLQAYRGPDADQRKDVFTNSREAVVASYKQARRAPHAKSARLLRQEKKDLKRLDQSLAQELCLLDAGLFDLSRVQGQVQQTEHYHFLRSFYFDEVNDCSIHNFCRTYATDAAYRAAVEQGTAPWVERNALFVKNLNSRVFRQLEGPSPDAEDDEGYCESLSLAEEQYFHWICQHATQILADPAYQRLRAQEQASERACTQGTSDPQMQQVVAAWSALPGVEVTTSCRGASGVFRFGGKTLLAPSAHEECTTLLVVSEEDSVFEAIGETVAACEHLCAAQLARPLRSTGSGTSLETVMLSSSLMSNTAARADLLRAASQVKARVRA